MFAEWNRAELDSYLIEITRDILGFIDKNGEATIDKIVDAAGQKGTGKWTVIEALDQGVPLDVDRRGGVRSRVVGSEGGARRGAEAHQAGRQRVQGRAPATHRRSAAGAVRVEDHQLRAGLSAAARGGEDVPVEPELWRHRVGLARRLHHSFGVPGRHQRRRSSAIAGLVNLLLDPFFREAVSTRQAGWRRAIVAAVQSGIPVPCMSAALSYFDGYRSERLPANLLQAQRDFFGAHTYERIDQPRGQFFHTDWTGHGGATTSRSYSA